MRREGCPALVLCQPATDKGKPALGANEIETLIGQLGSIDTAIHDRAAKDLRKLGSAALPRLQDCWRFDPELELRTRAAQIDTLVKQLGDPCFKVRVEATQKLRAIGPAAILQVEHACHDADPEIRKRSETLVNTIITDSNQIITDRNPPAPVRINGAEFVVLVDRIWSLPPPGASTAVRLALKMTNRTSRPIRFYFTDTAWPGIYDGHGKRLGIGGGRNATLPGVPFSPFLKAGESYTLDHFHARLIGQLQVPRDCNGTMGLGVCGTQKI